MPVEGQQCACGRRVACFSWLGRAQVDDDIIVAVDHSGSLDVFGNGIIDGAYHHGIDGLAFTRNLRSLLFVMFSTLEQSLL